MTEQQFNRAQEVVRKMAAPEERLKYLRKALNDGDRIGIETKTYRLTSGIGERESKKVLQILIEAEEENLANLKHSLSVI